MFRGRTRVLTILAAITLMLGVLAAPSPAAMSEEPPNAVFSVETPHWVWSHILGDEVGWTEGRTLTLSVDDDFDLGNGYLYQDSTPIEGPGGDWFFDLEGVFEIEPGHVVTADDGVEIVKQLLVVDIEVTEVNPEADTVTGTGPVGATVLAYASDQFGYEAYRDVEVGGDGIWIADFATPGTQPHQLDLQDIKLGTSGGAFVFDDDGDSPHRSWSLADTPVFWVSTPYYPEAHQIWHWAAWTAGRTLTVYVDDDFDLGNGILYSDSTVVGSEGEWYLDFEGSFEILPGHVVTADDGVDVTKQLMVQELEVIDVDLDADTVTGLGPVGATVMVSADEDGEPALRSVEVGGDGLWVADFANPGPELHEQELGDLETGTFGGAHIYDEDGDFTLLEWEVEEPPEPNFFVRPDGDEIWGSEWYGGPEVTVLIYDAFGTLAYETTFPTEDGEFYEGIDFNIVPLDHVVVTDGEFTKEHTVTELMVTEVDADADMVHGTAEPGAEVFVGTSMPGTVWEYMSFQFGPDNRNPDSLNEHLDFRRAIAHAIDRDTLVAELPGAGYAIDSYVDAFVPELSRHAWSQYPYDPAAAAALIDGLCTDLGRDCAANPPVAVFTTTSGNEDRELMANLLVPMFDAAGIELQLDLEDSGVFFGETIWEGTFDIGEWAFVGARSLWFLSGTLNSFDPEERFQQNLGNWGTPDSSVIDANTARMAELVGLMNSTHDRDELEAYNNEAELILADQAVIIPLYVREGDFEIDGPVRIVTADGDGNWTADFSVPWEDQDPLDLVPGIGGFAEESDEDGDATHAGWAVPTELSPLQLKESVRDTLVELAGTGDLPRQASRLVSSAADSIDASLEPSLWIDEYRLDPSGGSHVFRHEAKATQSLELAQRLLAQRGEEVPKLQEAIEVLVAADRTLAVTAIEDADAAGGDTAALEKAWSYIDSGDGYAASGRETKAIKEYRKAWEWALRSLDG